MTKEIISVTLILTTQRYLSMSTGLHIISNNEVDNDFSLDGPVGRVEAREYIYSNRGRYLLCSKHSQYSK